MVPSAKQSQPQDADRPDDASAASAPGSGWYVLKPGGAPSGPSTAEDVATWLRTGALPFNTKVCRVGEKSWSRVHEVPELSKMAGLVPPPPPAPPPSGAPAAAIAPPTHVHGASAAVGQESAVSQKSRVTFILLGLFLGGLGIHNFYAGYTGRAVAQLLISLLTGWLIFPLLGVGIWVLIELIAVDRDPVGKRFA
jgi:TM2 domain-containing membrane protein YozV